MSDIEVLTTFLGPGQWRSQAAELEDDIEEVATDEDPE